MPWSGSLPGLGEPVDQAALEVPGVVVVLQPRGARGRERDHQLAEHVGLPLLHGSVADPHRPRPGVPGEVVEGVLGKVPGAVDGVHDLEVVRVAGHGAQQPVPPEPRLVGVPGVDQRLDGQGGVAQPAVAVVPVPLAAELLGQRGGRGGDDAARLLVGHQAEREQRAADDVHVRHVVVALRCPGGVGGDRRLDRTVRARRRPVVGRDPGHREGQLVPGLDRELVDVAVAVGDRQTRPAQHELVRAGDGGDHLLAVDLAAPHPGRDGAVVHPDHPLVPEPHRAADARQPAYDVGPVVAGRHHVEQGDRAGVRGEGGLEGGGVSDVLSRHLVAGRRLELPVPVVVVAEQAREAGGRVEPRQAEPVDRAVLADQRGGVPVADEGIVLDRQRHVGNSSLVRHRHQDARKGEPPAAQALDLLRAAGATLATAESLTGGRLAALLTAVPGASAVYRGGVVTYASDVKVDAAGGPGGGRRAVRSGVAGVRG